MYKDLMGRIGQLGKNGAGVVLAIIDTVIGIFAFLGVIGSSGQNKWIREWAFSLLFSSVTSHHLCVRSCIQLVFVNARFNPPRRDSPHA